MSDDDKTPSRPNPGRKLTENRQQDDELVFYYSREKRLEKAPQRVRALYEEPPQKKFSLLRPLIANRPLATLFAMVMLLSVVSAIIAFSGIADRGYDFEGNRITVDAQRYEGTVILEIRKNPGRKDRSGESAAAVDIQISSLGAGEGLVFSHRLVFNPQREEEFRVVVPFESPELLFHIQGDRERLEFKVKTH
jgi:hypothetical protein